MAAPLCNYLRTALSRIRLGWQGAGRRSQLLPLAASCSFACPVLTACPEPFSHAPPPPPPPPRIRLIWVCDSS